MKKNKIKIEIKLRPSKKDWSRPAMNSYQFIDTNLTEGTGFFNFLFGNNGTTEPVHRGIWKTAYVKINDVELLIPFNKLKADKTRSCLFNAYSGIQTSTLSHEDAIKIATCFFLYHIIYFSSQNVFCGHFVNQYGEDILTSLFYILKYELFEDEKLRQTAYQLLD